MHKLVRCAGREPRSGTLRRNFEISIEADQGDTATPSRRADFVSRGHVSHNRDMPRILIAECKQEVSSFNPVPSRYEDFVIREGDEVFNYHAGRGEEVGGALAQLGSHADFELIPTYSAQSITSGGTLAASDFERIVTEFSDAIRNAGPADGAYFALHGAMAAENDHDPEGRLLQEARAILGEDLPIVISLDLHGVLTDRMLRHSDGIAVFHTYPHVDFYKTGNRAGRLLARILTGKASPVMARVKIPALVRGDELVTKTGGFGEVVYEAAGMEGRHEQCLAAGVLIGNPFTDVPELRSNSLVVTDGDPESAGRWATELAEGLWDRHESMRARLTDIPSAIHFAPKVDRTVVLMDPADAPSSGASGDSNAILREIVASGYSGRVLAPIVDAPAVQEAFRAGVGGRIRTTVGGTLDPARFKPLPFDGHVRLLADGRFQSESFGSDWYAGPTAVIEDHRWTLVVTSRPVNLYDRSLFFAHGQDPRRFDAVIVKSPHCEPHMFAEWCGIVIQVDAPGATSADIAQLGHKYCERPIFPLDPIPTFRPQVEVFERSAVR